MLTHILRRMTFSVLVIFSVLTLVFSMLHLVPGDPVRIMLGAGGYIVSGDDIQRLREELGLDDPLHIQYARFLAGAMRGDLGRSLLNRRPVIQEIASQLPSTLQLAFAGMGLAVILGILLGVVAALHAGSWIDLITMVFALLGVSMPEFWVGLLFIYLFGLKLRWFPIIGYGGLRRLVLPALVLGLVHSSFVARLTRSSLLEVMQQDYIRTARAKGLRERVVVCRHALKNAMIPVITFLGIQFGFVLSGAVVIETVFAREGLGRLTVDAILRKDFPVVQGAVLFIAAGYVVINLIVDVLYAFFDPRIRFD